LKENVQYNYADPDKIKEPKVVDVTDVYEPKETA
jgi:hypothetical protein